MDNCVKYYRVVVYSRDGHTFDFGYFNSERDAIVFLYSHLDCGGEFYKAEIIRCLVL